MARRSEGRTSRSGEGGSPERYPTIYLRVQGGGGGRRRWWGGGVGIAGEKARHGGAYRDGRGGGGPAVGSVFGAGGVAVWPVVAGGSGGVEVEDELQALDFVSNGCKID